MKVEWISTGRTTNALFLIKAMRILSGIDPRNVLSIETCWAPELTVKVLFFVCVTG